MGSRGSPRTRFLRTFARAAPRAVRALERQLEMDRRAAAETVAAAAALGLAGLARHQRHRPLDGHAAFQVVKKYGRPADLLEPDLGIAAHLARPGLSPRLGGLLGDGGPRAAEWIAARAGQERTASTRDRLTAEKVGRALAAVTPLVLGALADSVEARALTDWLSEIPDAPLDDPKALLAVSGDPSLAFLRLRRLGHPWWQRALGLGG